MLVRYSRLWCLNLLVVGAWAIEVPRFADARVGEPPARSRRPDTAPAQLSNLPLVFEESGNGAFQSRTHQHSLLFGESAVDMHLGPDTAIGMRFPGAVKVRPAGEDKLGSRSTYLRGGQENWRRGLAHYGKVRYPGLWKGVDLVFYGRQKQLEYDFVVAPGADTSPIRMRFEGADVVAVEAGGSLKIETAKGAMHLKAPVVYQTVDGGKRTVEGRYTMIDSHTVGFAIGEYDHSLALVIDPILDYSTYLGGIGGDFAFAMAIDGNGNQYLAGRTESPDLLQNITGTRLRGPSTQSDVFVIKLDSTGSRILYSTYLGGRDWDGAYGMTVDSTGAAYVTGITRSTDFPTKNPAQRTLQGVTDAFAVKLTPDGSDLVFSTYLGGTDAVHSGDASRGDEGYGVAVDSNGRVYIAGYTPSINFPVGTNSFRATFNGGETISGLLPADGFVVRLLADGRLDQGIFVGGTRTDGISDIGVDSNGLVYVTGGTTSTDFPLAQGSQLRNAGNLDAFVAVIDFNSRRITHSTYLGGSDLEEGFRLSVGRNNDVYITGYSSSADFPSTPRALSPTHGSPTRLSDAFLGLRPVWDAFVARYRLNPAGFAFARLLGGNGDDFGFGITVDPANRAYVTGYTCSRTFIITPGSYQGIYGGGEADAFITVIRDDGQVASSSFLGGSGQDEGYQIALDAAGNTYVAGVTYSGDFPVSAFAPQQNSRANGDSFAARIADSSCDVRVSRVRGLAPEAGGTESVTIATTTPSCRWMVSTFAPWITPDRTSGTGNATLGLRIARNTGADVRTAILSVNGRRTFVHQSGTNRCALKVTPSAVGLPPSSERRVIDVRAQSDDCEWRATSSAPWLRITAGSAGRGNGLVNYTVERNRTPQVRTAAINIGTRRVNVTQSASECRISLSSASGIANNAGGLGSVIVDTSTEDCAWTAVSRSPFLTILSGASGVGNGRVRFSVAQNTPGQERDGIIEISGVEFRVAQTNRFLSTFDASALASGGLNPFNEQSDAKDENGRAAVPNCGFTPPPQRIQLDQAGRAVEFPMTRSFDGCPISLGPPDLPFITAQIRNNNTKNPVLVLSAQSNPARNQRTARFLMTPGAGSPSFVITVDQTGAVATSLDLNPKDRIQLAAVATTGSVEVASIEPECTWEASAPQSWLRLRDTTGPCAAGVDFDAQANDSASPRTGRIVFSTGQEVEVEQRGVRVDCAFTFGAAEISFPVEGGTRPANVQTTAGCTWFASTDKEDWLSFPAGPSGNGPAALQVRAAPNDLPGERVSIVTVGGAQLIVRQQGPEPPPPCEFTLDPTSRNFPAGGGSGTFRVNTAANCAWRAATVADWIRITAGEGTGPGDVSFEVLANPEGGVSRSAEISVEGVTFRVTQEGAAVICTYSLTPESGNFAAAGGNGTFRVNTGADCAWTATTSAPWIRIVNGSGAGAGDVTFVVQANPQGSPARSGDIVVEGRIFRVNQDAVVDPGCSYTLSPTSRNFPVAGGASTFRVNAAAGCAWSAAANVTWIRVLVGASGSGNGEVAFEVTANTGGPRTGEINVQGAVFRVTQEGAAPPPGCTYSLSPTSTTYPAAGGEGTFRVNTSAGCEWTAASTASWITLVSGLSGSGSGDVRFSVAVNPAGSASRSADIRVQNQAFRVTQEAGGPPAGDSSITASPNPITQCQANGLGITTLTWRSTEPAPLQIRIGSPTGAVFGDVDSQGSGTTGDWVTDGMTFFLMKDGRTLSQVRVTLACPRPAGRGSIQASSTSVPVCDPPGSGSTTLSWTTVDVTAVQIRRDRFDGPLVTSGGASGTFAAQISFDTTFLLVDVSGGRAPAEAGVLSSVRVTRAPCDRPIGIAPPTTDLIEGNFGAWDLQFPFGANAIERRNNVNDVVSGETSIAFTAELPVTEISMRLRAPASRVWDFSTIRQIAFSLRTLNMAPSNWRGGSPSIELVSANGTRRMIPTINIAAPASQAWHEVRAPLVTASSWNVVDDGSFDISAVRSIRLIFQTLGGNYRLIVDGLFLRP